MYPRHDDVYSASMHLPVNIDIQYKYIVKSPAQFEELDRTVTLAGHMTVTRNRLDHPSTHIVPALHVSGDTSASRSASAGSSRSSSSSIDDTRATFKLQGLSRLHVGLYYLSLILWCCVALCFI